MGRIGPFHTRSVIFFTLVYTGCTVSVYTGWVMNRCCTSSTTGYRYGWRTSRWYQLAGKHSVWCKAECWEGCANPRGWRTRRDTVDGGSRGGGQRTVENSDMAKRKGTVVMMEMRDHGCRRTVDIDFLACRFVSRLVVLTTSCAFAAYFSAVACTVGPFCSC
jgi:hypothetical protein